MDFETAFWIAVAAAVAFLIFYMKATLQKKAVKEVMRQQNISVGRQTGELKAEKEQYLQEKIALGEKLVEQTACNKNLAEKLKTQAEDLQQLQDHFKKEFENLANKLLDEKSEKFTRQNQTNIEGLLKPLKERIKDFEKKIDETYNREARERFNLQKELRQMFELNQTLSEQANNLTLALKADTKKQGNWGEFILERILEASGLENGIHYKKQASLLDEDGSTRRPDVVIQLPESRCVIIDAKVSLTAYERYFSSKEDAGRQQALKDHLRSVRSHVDELSQKNYERLFNNSPDFVLMFIPVEPAYGLAMMQDNNLFSDAYRKKVIPVSVSSLLATLRIIEAMWKLEKQNRNAREIITQGSQLYDKIAGFTENMQALGIKLEGARHEYTHAMKKLSEGKGNMLRKAEQMKALGLDTKKRLPAGLAGNDHEEE